MLYGVEPERGLYFKEQIDFEDAFECDKEKPQIVPEEEGEEQKGSAIITL